MRLLNFIMLVCVILGSANYAWWSQQVAPLPSAPAIESSTYEPAPDFTYNNTSLYALKGNIVLLNFWASWCAPCQKEFPQLIELTKSFSNVYFLAVSVDHDAGAMQRFLHTQQISGNPHVVIVPDPDKKIAQDIYGSIRYPETYLISPDMGLLRKYVGIEVDWTSDDFKQQLRELGAR